MNKHDTTPAPKNLHPIWHRHFGFQTLQPTPQANRSQPPRHQFTRADGQILLRAVQALVDARGSVKPIY